MAKQKHDAIPPGPMPSRQDAIDWVEAELETARATFARTGEGQGRVGRLMRHLARLSDPETGEAYAATVAEERAHTIAVAPFVTRDEALNRR